MDYISIRDPNAAVRRGLTGSVFGHTDDVAVSVQRRGSAGYESPFNTSHHVSLVLFVDYLYMYGSTQQVCVNVRAGTGRV